VLGQQRQRRHAIESSDRQHGHVCFVECARRTRMGGEEQAHGLGVHTPCHEQQRFAGGRVEPLRVVDDREQRTPLGGAGQQRERRGVDREAIAIDRGAQRERRGQRA
jgi:hypothetical protein